MPDNSNPPAPDLPQIPTIPFQGSPLDTGPSPASVATMPVAVPPIITPTKIDQPPTTPPSIEEDLPLSEVVTALKSSTVSSPQPTPVQVPPPKADMLSIDVPPQSVTPPKIDQPSTPTAPSTKSPLYEDPDKVKTIGS